MNPPPSPDTGEDFGTVTGHDPGLATGRPRWVRVLGIIALLLAVLIVALKVTGLAGNHGPGRHTGGGGTPPSAVTDGTAHTPPAGMNHG